MAKKYYNRTDKLSITYYCLSPISAKKDFSVLHKPYTAHGISVEDFPFIFDYLEVCLIFVGMVSDILIIWAVLQINSFRENDITDTGVCLFVCFPSLKLQPSNMQSN